MAFRLNPTWPLLRVIDTTNFFAQDFPSCVFGSEESSVHCSKILLLIRVHSTNSMQKILHWISKRNIRIPILLLQKEDGPIPLKLTPSLALLPSPKFNARAHNS